MYPNCHRHAGTHFQQLRRLVQQRYPSAGQDRLKPYAVGGWSTGPVSEQGKAIVSRNAWKGGVRPTLRGIARLLREMSAEID